MLLYPINMSYSVCWNFEDNLHIFSSKFTVQTFSFFLLNEIGFSISCIAVYSASDGFAQ